MFTIDSDKTINATRGDVLYFGVSAEDEEGQERHTFQPGDIVRMSVYGKKDCTNVVMQKDFAVTTPTEEIEIMLEKKDTKIGDTISKPKDYWYEIVLNPETKPQTIIGYDGDGAKVMRLYPEGGELPSGDEEVSPEDIPFIDDALDLISERPVKNRVIAAAIVALMEEINVLKNKLTLLTSSEETDTTTEQEGETV